MIRTDAGMSTARFCKIIDMPERTWRRWQAKARAQLPVKGPWPAPVAEANEPYLVKQAEAHPAWGHRKVWAMTRHDGCVLSGSTALRVLRRRGLTLPAHYTRERRSLAAARRAAFLNQPTGPNQVWQLDFSEFETSTGGTWRIAGCTDYWSKYELGWHIALTANQHDAIAAVALAIVEAQALAGESLLDAVTDKTTGEIRPVVVVTDNGGPFRSHRFADFISSRRDVEHVRTKIKTPGQNGVRERAFRDVEVRAALPRGHHRWRSAGRARRRVPGRVQHDPTARSPRLEPTPRRPPRPRPTRHTQLSRPRNPANSLTQDRSLTHLRMRA